jgi:hypothetical protein
MPSATRILCRKSASGYERVHIFWEPPTTSQTTDTPASSASPSRRRQICQTGKFATVSEASRQRQADGHTSAEHGNVTTMRPCCGRAWCSTTSPWRKSPEFPNPQTKPTRLGIGLLAFPFASSFQGTSCPSRETWGVIDCLKRTFSSRSFNLARSPSGA